MPLVTSPIDGSPMLHLQRYGIEVDICPTSGGVWLDRGELEKLAQLIREDALTDDDHHQIARRNRSHDTDDEDDDYEGRRGRRKSRLLDLFDL